jgi:hypothetical protein
MSSVLSVTTESELELQPTAEDKLTINIIDVSKKDFSHWERMSVADALSELLSNENGLMSGVADERAQLYGRNEVPIEKKSAVQRFCSFLYVHIGNNMRTMYPAFSFPINYKH